MIPTLQTERLTLRPYERSDWDAYRAFTKTDRTKFMGGPVDEEKAWGWFTNDIASWALNGFGTLAIDYNGKMIGTVGLVHPPHFPEAEIGWVLYEGYEGQGFATEAAKSVLDHAFATTQLPSIVSYVNMENHRSQAVAKRLGGVIDADAKTVAGDEHDTFVFRYTRNRKGTAT